MSKHSIQNDPEIQQWMENERIDYRIKSEAIAFGEFITNDPQELHKMSQNDFVEKTKAVLNKIYNSYCQSWQSRRLMDEEYPEESVCDKCTGWGKFIKNGEEKECVQDREQGECFYRFCDYEQVGIDLEANLEDMSDLLSVDEIN